MDNNELIVVDGRPINTMELNSLIENKVQAIARISDQIETANNKAEKAKLAVDKAKSAAEKAKTSAGNSKSSHSVGYIFGKKGAIEALQDQSVKQADVMVETSKAITDLAEAQTSMNLAQKDLFENQARMIDATEYLFQLGTYNLYCNDTVYNRVKRELEGISKEQRNELARQELKKTLDRLKEQRSSLTRIKTLEETVGIAKDKIIELHNNQNEIYNEINTQTLKDLEHDKRLNEQESKDQEHDKRLNEQEAKDQEHDKRLNEQEVKDQEHDKRLNEQEVKDQEHDKRLNEQEVKSQEHDKRLDDMVIRNNQTNKIVDEHKLLLESHANDLNNHANRISELELMVEKQSKEIINLKDNINNLETIKATKKMNYYSLAIGLVSLLSILIHLFI